MALRTVTVNGLTYMESDVLGTRHAFTTRFGGVSEGIYASLNLGANRGDEPERVRENYRLIGKALSIAPERLVFSRQVHEAEVRLVTAQDSQGDLFAPTPYAADGLVTVEKDVPLIIFTADCIPVLLSDPAAGVIGAVHAGWRGTVLDIVGIAVKKMKAAGGSSAQDIRAAIGPGIGSCCFETDSEVPRAIRRVLGSEADAFIERRTPEKAMVDLKGVNRALLLRAGVLPEHIDVSEECTRCNPDKYWSHRYTDGQRGSQASIIVRV